MADVPAGHSSRGGGAGAGGRGGSGARGRGRGGRGGAGSGHASASDSDGHDSARSSYTHTPFSVRGGRGGHSSHAHGDGDSLEGEDDDASSNTLPTYTSAGVGAPLSTSVTRQHSTVSTASSSAGVPDCLLCCYPISSFCLSTCQHSAQICGTCILRVQLFVTKKPKPGEVAAAAAAPSSSSSSAPAVPGADLLNDENDFRPSPASIAANEARKHRCPYCQSDWSTVLITREYDVHSSDPRLMPPPSSSFGLATDHARYPLHRWVYDQALNVYFENEVTRNKYKMMQSLYCVLCYNLADAFSPSSPPSKRFDKVHLYSDVKQLEAHLKQAHQRFLCTACVTTRKIFIHEQQVFTHRELLHHFQHGSNEKTVTEYQPSGHVNAGVIEPHPFCQFCSTPFFTSDELYVHLTTDHRSCRFCQSEGFNKYFRTDNALRAHFKQHHFLCEEGKCKTVPANHAAFRDVLAHRKHMLDAHSDTLTKAQIKELQTIDLDLFSKPLGAGGVSRLAGGHQSRSLVRPEDEFEFRTESPPRGPAPVESFTESVEDFPSLGGGAGGNFAGSSMSLEARSRYAREASRRAASLAAPSASSSMPRSHSHPVGLNQSLAGPSAAQQLFGGRREEAFPALSSNGTAGPLVAPAADAGFRVRGPPPALNEFPTLRSVVKQEAKQAKKAEEKKAAKARESAGPSASPPVASAVQDTRILSSVPLPLPAPVPASESAARNKALVGQVRAALRNDTDAFESFKTLGARFREGSIGCEKYLQRFNEIFARNPAGPADTERLLMELCAMLPDEAQRRELHQEYAKTKVLANVERMKKNAASSATKTDAKTAQAASAAPSSASAVAAASPAYAAPKAKAVSSLGPASSSSASPSPSVSPAPAASASASASAAPSFARVASPGTFEVVKSAQDAKESRQAARRAAAAQGIAAFEGVAVRPLKRDDDEPTDFLSAVAAKAAEKERREKAEREAHAKHDDKPPPGLKKGWTGDGAAVLAAPSGRMPPGLSAPSAMSHSTSSPALSKLGRQTSNTWSALSGDGDDKPAQISEPVGAAGPSGRGKAQRAAAAYRTASPDSSEEVAEFDPPLPTLSASTAPVVLLPEADEVEHHVERISSLRIAPAAKASLELLVSLFHRASSLIQARYGAINGPSNRRHHMSEPTRATMTAMLRQTRWLHALEFSRMARLGMMPASVQALSTFVTLSTRLGNDQSGELGQQALSSMGAHDLFLLLEYLHALLLQLCKSTHPDLREAEAAFAADEERRRRQNEMFPTARAATAAAAAAAAAPASDAPAAPPKAGKKKKEKQLLFRSGGM